MARMREAYFAYDSEETQEETAMDIVYEDVGNKFENLPSPRAVKVLEPASKGEWWSQFLGSLLT